MLELSSGFSMLQRKLKKKKSTSQVLLHVCSLVNVVHLCLALNTRINVSLPYKLTLTIGHTQITLQKQLGCETSYSIELSAIQSE